MEPLIDTTRNEPIRCMKENTLDVACANCVSASSTDASDDSLGTMRTCTLDILPAPSQDRDALRLDHEENSTCTTSSSPSGTKSPLEQQLGRFEEYVRPVLELFNLPQLPTSVLSIIWAEVAPYQVSCTRVSVNLICEFLLCLCVSMYCSKRLYYMFVDV